MHLLNKIKSNDIFTAFGFILTGLIALSVIARYNYLLFHILVELTSIVIMISLFTITWNIRKHIENHYLLVVGISSLFIGVLDLMHTVTFDGMNIIQSNVHYAPQFWIVTRLLESATLFTGFTFLKLNKRPNPTAAFLIYTAITAVIIAAVLKWNILPPFYIEGHGQTAIKIYAEYVIIFILLMALFMLYQNKNYFDKRIYSYIFMSIVSAIISEICFALYFSNFDIFNQIGHYAKVITFFCIYRANVEEGFMKPAETLFKTIKANEVRYKNLSNELAAKNEEYVLLNQKYKEQNDLLTGNESKLKDLNATKDKFFSIIAHDLRNIFTPITMYSDMLAKNSMSLSQNQITGFSGNINAASRHAYNLFENLLKWSSMQSGKLVPSFEKISIKGLLEEIKVVKTQLAGLKSIRIHFDINDHYAFADKEMVRTVLRNLVNNAIKFTSAGGSISVTTYLENNTVVFCVKDTGIGISEAHIDKLFRIDSNITRPGTAEEKGSGLGLILCWEFVEKNNGKIWAESKEGDGSSFYFSVPEYQS